MTDDLILVRVNALCMIVQSAISEVTRAPVWHRPGFLMNVFGGMRPVPCFALRLALLRHDVSLRFQSIISCWYVLQKRRPVKAPVCNRFCL